ncbi:MAG: hypothetical protein DI635_04070 [Pseudoxanthomonas suwonensis]|nr:MAG: hypothetical protein DI635_04070 [Pseudoxanthomonas suwonensis]
MTIQQQLISGVLARFGGNQRRAAETLGISVPAMNRYVKEAREAEDEAIILMSEFLGRDTDRDVCQHRAETAKSERVRRFWLSMASAAILVLATAPSLAFAALTSHSGILCKAQTACAKPWCLEFVVMLRRSQADHDAARAEIHHPGDAHRQGVQLHPFDCTLLAQHGIVGIAQHIV